jgi:prevent-host-death family protein
MKVVDTISEAKAQLSALVERALAGEEVVIGRAGKPVVRLVPIVQGAERRRPGTLKGKIVMASDFDVLPPDIAEALGMEP